jgi:hypothetical protein
MTDHAQHRAQNQQTAPAPDRPDRRRGGAPESAAELADVDRRRTENWESEGGTTAAPTPSPDDVKEEPLCDDGSSPRRSPPTR